MVKVNIYLETDSTVQASRKRQYGYVLETEFHNELRTVEGFGAIEGTYHQTVLHALIEALGRLRKTCELQVYTRDIYIASRIPKLKEMADHDFRDAKGEEIKNADEWRKVYYRLTATSCNTEAVHGKHSYSQWLLEEMIRRDAGGNEKGSMEPEAGAGHEHDVLPGHNG